jgi:hypothetical protein
LAAGRAGDGKDEGRVARRRRCFLWDFEPVG